MQKINKVQKGDFIKHVGGDFGIYFDGYRWLKFQCLGCLYATQKVNKRLNNGDMNAYQRKLFMSCLKNSDLFHDKNIHNEWLKNGKLVNKI